MQWVKEKTERSAGWMETLVLLKMSQGLSGPDLSLGSLETMPGDEG